MGGKAYRYGEDFLVATTNGTATGALVYAGHGWVIPSKNIDAYKGVDVRDKIVIVSAGLPPGVERAALATTIMTTKARRARREARRARRIMITNFPDFNAGGARGGALERPARLRAVAGTRRDGIENAVADDHAVRRDAQHYL